MIKYLKDNLFTKEYLGISLVMCLIFLMRLPVVNWVVFNPDEALYLYTARGVLDGDVYLRDVWTLKTTFIPHLLFLPIFGMSIVALRIVTTIYLLATMFVLYLISRRFFDIKYSLIPPFVYGLFFLRFGGLATNGELLMMLPVALAGYCLIFHLDRGRFTYLMAFLCGALSVFSVILKQTALFSVILYILIVIWYKWKDPEYSWNHFWKSVGAYVVGALLVLILFVSYFALNGVMKEFHFHFFELSAKYATLIPFKLFLVKLATFFKDVFTTDLITVLAILSLAFVFIKYHVLTLRDKRLVLLLTVFTVLSFLGFAWPKRVFAHYYLQMAAPYSLLIAFAFSLMSLKIKNKNRVFITLTLSVLIFLSAIVYNLNKLINQFEERGRKNRAYFEISDYINKNSSSKDTIYVMGQPIIYLLSDRKAPTKYFFHVWAIDKEQRKVFEIEEEVANSMKTNKPKFIISELQRPFKRYFNKHLSQDNLIFDRKIGIYNIFRFRPL